MSGAYHGRTHRPGGTDAVPARLTAAWTGTVPSATQSETTWEVPYDIDGTVKTFHMTRAMLRIETVGTGSLIAIIEKASGGDVAFASPTTLATVTVAAAGHRGTAVDLTGTMDSGDLVRLTWTSIAAAGSKYSAHITGAE